MPIGFNFSFMGNNYSTIYIEGSGFCRFDVNYYYLINPFTVQMEDKGTSTSLSPLSYKVEGTSPNRILKIEWNNCGFVNDVTGTANFQLWLYETSNIIETHIGSCTANASAYNGNTNPGAAMGIWKFNSTTFCVYGIGLLGNPALANDSVIQNANADIFDFSLTGTPASGNVYRFSPGSLSVNENEMENDWIVFPNPVSDKLNILNLNSENKATVFKLSDVTGKIILTGSVTQKAEVDFTSVSAGIYFLIIRNGSGELFSKKIIKSQN